MTATGSGVRGDIDSRLPGADRLSRGGGGGLRRVRLAGADLFCGGSDMRGLFVGADSLGGPTSEGFAEAISGSADKDASAMATVGKRTGKLSAMLPTW